MAEEWKKAAIPQSGRNAFKCRVFKRSNGAYDMTFVGHFHHSCTYELDATRVSDEKFRTPDGRYGLNKCLGDSAIVLTNPLPMQPPVPMQPPIPPVHMKPPT